MSTIIIDGPEKAGKTTLILELVSYLISKRTSKTVVMRKWSGRASPDESEYFSALLEDTYAPLHSRIAVWDRAWPSEWVYGYLLKQPRRLVLQPELNEVPNSILQSNGIGVILIGESALQLARDRSGDDLPVSAEAERRLYSEYAKAYNWLLLEREPVEKLVFKIVTRLLFEQSNR